MEEDKKVEQIEHMLTQWVTAVKLRNARGYTDINRTSENLALRLLNAVYGYRLENLNWTSPDYPAADLGDRHEGIAFQVTATTTAAKIRQSLEKFHSPSGPHRQFFGGLYFFFITGKTPSITKKVKDDLQEKYSGFHFDSRMIAIDRLLRQVQQLYSTDPRRFDQVETILNKEFGYRKEKVGRRELLEELFCGSKRYLESLRGRGGRFRNLIISDTLLSPSRREEPKENPWLDTPVTVDGKIRSPSENPEASLRVSDAVPKLWAPAQALQNKNASPRSGCGHALLKGEGGMGKTVSLIRLWERYTETGVFNPMLPVPVFIPLNEYNELKSGTSRKDFIQGLIRKFYLKAETRGVELLDVLGEPFNAGHSDAPSVILLLDGLNEVTVERTQLEVELREILEHWQGVQVVVTSRVDMRDTMGWAGFHLLELLGLEEAQIEKYLKERGLFASGGPPGNQRATPPGIPKALRALLQNPMMLTIYAASCEVVERFKNSGLYQFKRQVETPGELLWNFMEAQVVKYDLHTGQDKRQKYFYKFLLRMILPALGYEMEKAGRFQLEGPELDVILVSYFKRFSLTEFFRSFPEYLDYSDAWDISGCDAKGILKKAYNILNILSGEMAMLVREGESYRFLHQNFRDFFVAVFILNEVEISFKRVEVAEVLTGGAISYYVRRYLGEIEGEHLNKPYLVEGLGWQIKSNESALLARALEMCRGKYGASYDNAVMNILESWKLLRGELSGLDFSRLDLSKVLFNNVRCSRLYEITYLASRFDESIIQKNTLFPGGHSSFINSAVYSSDGQKILSASHDQTVKEWDLAIGTCIQTYQEHKHLVNSAVYGCDCKKILSASWDQTVKEWDVLTGRCIRTYRGHTSDVNHAVYSRDCKKIVSASRDQTVKEWDVDTGKCIHTYQGHTSDVSSAVYSPDCKKILSASGDQTVKEWDVDTGKCIQTYQGHTSEVNHAVYNRDGKKIVSASYDDTVKEWDVDNGTCTCTYQGHWNTVYRAFYSRDGKKILSSSSDHTIKEWDAATGTCIRTYQGHDKDVLCAVYSPDGKKILSASEDQTVKEWDVATGTCMRTYQGYIHAFASVAYGNNGQKILSASWDHTVKEWNAATGKCIRTYQGHNHWVLSAVYSPDGQKILSASGDRTVKEWNAATGTCIRTYKGHASFVNSAAYSPDGQKILSASHDETVKEWDVETGKCLGTWKKKETPQHDSPDIIGRKLTFENKQAERDGNKIKITDRKTGENLQTFINIPGLLIQGCSFQNLHRKSNLTDENTELMKMYGATVSGKKNNY